MSAISNYLENKLIDFVFRGQPFTPPATIYFALLTSAPSDAGGGVEVSGGGYLRVAKSASLVNFSGTQGSGSTVASTGTTGTTSNNNPIVFPAPTATWGVVSHIATYDAATGGNLLEFGSLDIAKTINNGDDPPSFATGAFSFQIDA